MNRLTIMWLQLQLEAITASYVALAQNTSYIGKFTILNEVNENIHNNWVKNEVKNYGFGLKTSIHWEIYYIKVGTKINA